MPSPVRLVAVALIAAALVVPSAASAVAVPPQLPLPTGSTWILSGLAGLDAGLPREVNASWSGTGAISADGRYVAFASNADGLAPGSADDGAQQVYRKDRQTGEVRLMSVSSADGAPATDTCGVPRISADGSAVAFACAGHLSAADTDATSDLYLRRPNRRGGYETVLVTAGTQTPVYGFDLSADAGRIAVSVGDALDAADTNAVPDVYVRTLGLLEDTWRLASRRDAATPAPPSGAKLPSISDDGTVVAYRAYGLDLVGGPASPHTHVFRTALTATTVTTTLMDADAGGVAGNQAADQPQVSGDGTAVAFTSAATNLGAGGSGFTVYVRDGGTLRIASAGQSAASLPALDADGDTVAFVTNNTGVWRQQGTAAPTAVAPPANLADSATLSAYGPGIDAAGGLVAYSSEADLTVDVDPDETAVFVEEVLTGNVGLASRPAGSDPFVSANRGMGLARRVLSADGTRALLLGKRAGLGLHHNLAVVRNLVDGTLTLASRGNGATGDIDGEVTDAALSGDGRHVAWVTSTPVLPLDVDSATDVYVRDLETGRTYLASVQDDGTPVSGDVAFATVSHDGARVAFQAGGALLVRDVAAGRTQEAATASFEGALTADGRAVVFASRSALTTDDGDANADVFLRDLRSGQTTLVSDGAEAGADAYAPIPSSAGRVVAYRSTGADGTLSEVLVRDVTGGTTNGPFGPSTPAFDLSGDGRTLALWTTEDLGAPVRSDGQARAVVHDLTTGSSSAPVREAGGGPAPLAAPGLPRLALSGGGACLAFPAEGATQLLRTPGATSPDLHEVYVHAVTAACGAPVAGPELLDTPPVKQTPQPAAQDAVPTGGVDARGQGSSTQGGASRPRDLVAPRITALRLSSAKLKRRRGSTTLRFNLDERATVKVAYERCVKTRRGRCLRWRAAGTVTRPAGAGRVALKLTAKAGRRTLAAGRYRLAISAVDAAGNRSAVQRRALTIRG